MLRYEYYVDVKRGSSTLEAGLINCDKVLTSFFSETGRNYTN